jgi:putative flippase GtrA
VTSPEAEPGLLLRIIRDQRVAFLIVGGINTVVGFALFVGFDLLLGPTVDALTGEVIGSLIILGCAHVVGTLFAFVLHRRFVFRVQGHVVRDLLRFESVYLVALGINALALPLLVHAGMERIIAQALITLATTVISYAGHRYFSFRRPATDESTTS